MLAISFFCELYRPLTTVELSHSLHGSSRNRSISFLHLKVLLWPCFRMLCAFSLSVQLSLLSCLVICFYDLLEFPRLDAQLWPSALKLARPPSLFLLPQWRGAPPRPRTSLWWCSPFAHRALLVCELWDLGQSLAYSNGIMQARSENVCIPLRGQKVPETVHRIISCYAITNPSMEVRSH